MHSEANAGMIQIIRYTSICKEFASNSTLEKPHIAYLWRETPIQGYKNAPIQSLIDGYGLPGAPWKIPASDISLKL